MVKLPYMCIEFKFPNIPALEALHKPYVLTNAHDTVFRQVMYSFIIVAEPLLSSRRYIDKENISCLWPLDFIMGWVVTKQVSAVCN